MPFAHFIRYLSRSVSPVVLAAACTAVWMPQEAAAAASVAVTAPTDPTAEVVTTITASGSVSTSRRLFAFVDSPERSCEPTAYLESLRGTAQSLTPSASGVALTPGSFAQSLPFTAPSRGIYRTCVYVSPSSYDAPEAAASHDFAARAPRASVLISGPSAGVEDSSFGVSITGDSEVSRELFVFIDSSSEPCAPTVYEQRNRPLSRGIGPTSVGVPIGPGRFSQQFQATLGRVRSEQLCAYVAKSSFQLPEARSSWTVAVIAPTPAPLPVAVPEPVAPAPSPAAPPMTTQRLPDDSRFRPDLSAMPGLQFDRLELRWTGEGDPAEDEVTIWDEDPDDLDVEPLIDTSADDTDEFELSVLRSGLRILRVRRHLGYRPLWFRVTARVADRSGIRWVSSGVMRASIAPSPMVEDEVRTTVKRTAGYSSAHPGHVRLRIDSSPRARVAVTVRHRGRVYAKRRYTEGVGGLRGFDFALSCSRTGVFRFEVKVEDPYGARAIRRGHWTSSATRCAALRAKEAAKRRAAERRQRAAAERRRAAERRASQRQDASAGGGSGCDAAYEGACLDPSASDYDCSGGSGDGPQYVDGPVRVVGDDHFDLDRNGDGIGCED